MALEQLKCDKEIDVAIKMGQSENRLVDPLYLVNVLLKNGDPQFNSNLSR